MFMECVNIDRRDTAKAILVLSQLRWQVCPWDDDDVSFLSLDKWKHYRKKVTYHIHYQTDHWCFIERFSFFRLLYNFHGKYSIDSADDKWYNYAMYYKLCTGKLFKDGILKSRC